ncbi:MAG: MlaD family protein [Propionibacteriales bacterium]|nr:MlaD family protein [Propionibacteriales bacterium]
MTTLLTRVQLVVFTLVTVLAVGYGSIQYFNVGEVFSPPFEVRAEFASAGGIYERADVDLLGTRVGTVREIVPGPGAGTTVVMALDNGVKIPRDVTATIGNKSAIGEQYVELAPRTAGGPVLSAGDVIGRDSTTSPIDVSVLLGDLNALSASIPTGDLAVAMKELSTALSGNGPALGNLIDNTERLTRVSLDNVDDLNALIDEASTVLDTQVEKGPQTATLLRENGRLVAELRRVDSSFADLFANGLLAGKEVSNLLADNASALPVLLNQLVTLTDLTADRLPAVRKTLVLFPYALEGGATGIRRCGSYNAKTGKPVESTCRYDREGRPIYNTYLSFQLSQPPGAPPYFPCTKGYGGTTKYYPNGVPVKGGARQLRDSPVNMEAGCTASPDDPNTPLVRGAQNVVGAPGNYGRSAPWGLEIYDPTSPPSGEAGLAWLLTNPMN